MKHVLICLCLVTVVFVPRSVAQKRNVDSMLNVLRDKDEKMYELVVKLKRESALNKSNNHEDVYNLSAGVISLIRKCEKKIIGMQVAAFFSRSDSTLFTQLHQIDSLQVPDTLKTKYRYAYALYRLRKYDGSPLDTIAVSIYRIDTLFREIDNTTVKNGFTQVQAEYIDNKLKMYAAYLKSWYKVASHFNVNLLTKKQKQELLETYTEPLQQLYLKGLPTTD